VAFRNEKSQLVSLTVKEHLLRPTFVEI